MKYVTLRGQTGNIAFVFLPDSTSTTGGGKTGLTNASAALNVSVRREKSATMTAYSGANIGAVATLGTWVDPGAGKCNFKEVDSTNAPGLYEIHFVDSLFGTSDTSRRIAGMVTATGIVPTPFELTLSAVDLQSATSFITGVNALAPPTNWNLEVIDGSGRLDVSKIAGTSQTARDLGASVLLSSGTGAGQVSLSSGAVTVGTNNDKTGYTASTVSDKTGYSLTQAFPSNFSALGISVGGALNVAPASGFFGNLPSVTVGSNSDKTGYSLSGTQTFSNTGTWTGNLSGSVGSVSGNVGGSVASVTARVTANTDQLAGQTVTAAAGVTFPASVGTSTFASGQNVGAAASVTGAVGSVTGNVGGNLTGTIGGYASGQDPATLVLDATASGHNTAGTVGAKINSAGSVADPWATALPGSYTTGQAGNIVGSNLNATISSRQASGNVTVGGYASGQDPATLVFAQVIESGVSMLQMMRLLGAAVGAVLSGAATTTITLKAVGNSGTTRVVATVDTDGNRSALTLTL